MIKDDSHLAAEIRARLAERIGGDRFDLWFGADAQFRLSERGLVVIVACSFTRDWLQRNFAEDVRTCCQAVTGRDVRVEFEVDETLAAAAANQVLDPADSPPMAPVVQFDTPAPTVEADLRPHVPTRNGRAAASGRATSNPSRNEPTLQSIVVGKSNEYAVRAAEVTAHGVQQASPVLFSGPTGVGKTQLLRAVRAEYRHSRPRARAVYLTAEQFIGGFVEALRGSGLPSFRQKCRGADLLLVDDLQFFAGKRASLDELLHTFDVLLAEGRQLVLASDRSLGELRFLGKELVSRLASGLVCEIQMPDFAMRLEIVRRLGREMSLELGEDVATLVATQINGGARQLRGALHRLQAMCLAFGQTVSRQLAASALADLAQQCTRHVRLCDVEQAVCSVFGVEPVALRSDRKSRSVHEPRMLAMWLARKYTRAPWSEIGEFFGRKSHSTVISAHKRVEKLIRSQAEIGLSHSTCGVEEAIRRVEVALRTA